MLASASPARAKVLSDAGLHFSVQVADVDEDAVLERSQGASFADQVSALAKAKSVAVANSFSEGLNKARLDDEVLFVLGCDSMFEFEGRLAGKPYTREKAFESIMSYRGRSGTLHTGHALCEVRGESVKYISKTVSTSVHFGSYSEEDARRYVETDEPLQVAGSFAIDARGGAFIERIEGDYQSVVGVSVYALQELLKSFGYSIADFWG